MFFLGVWFAMILILSVVPVPGPKTALPADKIVHFAMYGLTSVLVFRYLRLKETAFQAFYVSVILASVYGAAMEVLQHFLPYRSFSVGDMAANTLGAFFCCLLYMKVKN